MAANTKADWERWQGSWDRQQEYFMPDREERFRVMLDMVEATVGPRARILDLACGTGSITARALRRFPEARSTGADLDPALLTIARGTFDGDERAEFVSVDLREADWTDRLPHRAYDAVLTATALHWMRTEQLAVLYGQLAGLVREGGVFMNADHMPDESTPRINEAVRDRDRARRAREKESGVLDWAEWWQSAERDEVLAAPTAERFGIFGRPEDGDHFNDEVQSPAWHVRALRDGGFAEARTVWASPRDALVLALR
jgi:trans-aconitate methyltransferase